MKNKKGFTLIELLVVIVILGILLLIAVPSIQKYLKRGTKDYYTNLEQTVMLAGRDYLNDYRALLPKEINNVTVIDLDELTSNKYIDEVVDSNGKNCRAKITAKKVGKNEYEYYSCLMCDDYDPEGNDEECKFDENKNITAETKNYRVVVDAGEYEIDVNGVYIVEQGEDFDLPYAKAYYTQNGSESKVSDKVVGNPKTINTNKLGTTTVTYVYKGAKAEIKVKVVDRVKPNTPKVVLKYDNNKGKVYKDEWYSGDIYQEFESTDYSKTGLSGSGIRRYEVSTDGTTYTALKGNNQTSSENGEHSYYVRSIDKSGNVSDSNTYSLKIDKEVPKCELEVKSGILGSNGWYTTNVTIGFKSITEKVSSIKSQTISQEQVAENTTGTKITAMVIDQAGNVGTCSIDVKIDKESLTKPILTSNSISGGNTIIADFEKSTAFSGIAKYECYYGISEASINRIGSVSENTCTFNNVVLSESPEFYIQVIATSNAGQVVKSDYRVQKSRYLAIKTTVTYKATATYEPESYNIYCNKSGSLMSQYAWRCTDGHITMNSVAGGYNTWPVPTSCGHVIDTGTRQVVTGYTCPDGGKLSDKTCTKTVYKCPEGGTLNSEDKMCYY